MKKRATAELLGVAYRRNDRQGGKIVRASWRSRVTAPRRAARAPVSDCVRDGRGSCSRGATLRRLAAEGEGGRRKRPYPGYACQSLMHLWFSVVAFRRRRTRTRPPLWRHGSASFFHFSLHSTPPPFSIFPIPSLSVRLLARLPLLFYTRLLARGSFSSPLPLVLRPCFLRRLATSEQDIFLSSRFTTAGPYSLLNIFLRDSRPGNRV